MHKFSNGQRKALSEICGNISVAWFSGGIISPLYLKPKSLLEGIVFAIVGLVMAVIFAFISISLMKGVK